MRAGAHIEPGIVTSGDALGDIAQFLAPDAAGFTAADVMQRVDPSNAERRTPNAER